MKKSIILVSFLTIVFIYFFGKSGLSDVSTITPRKSPSLTKHQKIEKDDISTSQAAIKRPDMAGEVEASNDLELMARKKELIVEILEASEAESYQENIVKGIENTLQGNNDENRKKSMREFADALGKFPFAEEFQKVLSKYSEDELEYLLGNMNHPANKKASAIQKENIEELSKIARSQEKYLASEEKQAIIDEILDASNALEKGMIIGDATTKPIFMAIHKKQNPEANIHEMEAFAEKLISTTRKQQALAMNNVMNWSFGKVDKETLQDYRRYVNQNDDRKIDDKYTEDMKAFYGEYGKHLAEQLIDLMAKLNKSEGNKNKEPQSSEES